MSALLAHSDATIREAAQQALQQASQAASTSSAPYSAETCGAASTPWPASTPAADVMVPQTQSSPVLSAALMGEPTLEFHSDELVAIATGDVTDEWQPILAQFQSMNKAFLLGRVTVMTNSSGTKVMVMSFNLVNDGSAPWPSQTTLRIASGSPFGSEHVDVGEVAVGSNSAITLKLEVPSGVEASRSAWALESNGEPFGPMLIVEVFGS